MVKSLLGKKMGMTQVFGEDGEHVPVTVLRVGPCMVTQVKTEETDEARAVQVGFEEAKPKNTPEPLLGHFRRSGVSPKKVLADVEPDDDTEFEEGQRLGVEEFEEVQMVDVTGVSKGRGFAGVVKRYGFSGGPATHGSKVHRGPGSIGAGTDPGRVLKGQRMAGHMGNETVTVKNLEVVRVDRDQDVLLVKGSVPGPKGGYVVVKKATGTLSD